MNDQERIEFLELEARFWGGMAKADWFSPSEEQKEIFSKRAEVFEWAAKKLKQVQP